MVYHFRSALSLMNLLRDRVCDFCAAQGYFVSWGFVTLRHKSGLKNVLSSTFFNLSSQSEASAAHAPRASHLDSLFYDNKGQNILTSLFSLLHSNAEKRVLQGFSQKEGLFFQNGPLCRKSSAGRPSFLFYRYIAIYSPWASISSSHMLRMSSTLSSAAV